MRPRAAQRQSGGVPRARLSDRAASAPMNVVPAAISPTTIVPRQRSGESEARRTAPCRSAENASSHPHLSLVYPMLDDRNTTRSSHAIVDPRVWNRASNLAGWDAYLAGNAGGDDVSAYAAPARATELAGLPPAYINVGTLDLFVDEDIAYAQALRAANVPTELRVYPGAFHGSPTLVPDSELSRRWRRDELSALDRALNDPR